MSEDKDGRVIVDFASSEKSMLGNLKYSMTLNSINERMESSTVCNMARYQFLSSLISHQAPRLNP